MESVIWMHVSIETRNQNTGRVWNTNRTQSTVTFSVSVFYVGQEEGVPLCFKNVTWQANQCKNLPKHNFTKQYNDKIFQFLSK